MLPMIRNFEVSVYLRLRPAFAINFSQEARHTNHILGGVALASAEFSSFSFVVIFLPTRYPNPPKTAGKTKKPNVINKTNGTSNQLGVSVLSGIEEMIPPNVSAEMKYIIVPKIIPDIVVRNTINTSLASFILALLWSPNVRVKRVATKSLKD